MQRAVAVHRDPTVRNYDTAGASCSERSLYTAILQSVTTIQQTALHRNETGVDGQLLFGRVASHLGIAGGAAHPGPTAGVPTTACRREGRCAGCFRALLCVFEWVLFVLCSVGCRVCLLFVCLFTRSFVRLFVCFVFSSDGLALDSIGHGTRAGEAGSRGATCASSADQV